MIIGLVLASSLLAGGALGAVSAAGCTKIDQLGSGCASVDAGTDGREVDLRGEVTTPGSAGSGGSGRTPNAEGVVASPPASGPPREERGRPSDDEGIIVPRQPVLQPNAPEAEPVEEAEPLPAVTIDDLASFAPSVAPVEGEPAGWGIVGLETNFYAGSATHVVDGELLGRPASVRFSPVGWHWSYGDGATRSTATPGAPWGSVADEFEPTHNSHRYSTPGTYRVELAVEYAAEFRFGVDAWVPVPGTVTASAEPFSVRIGTADTVLVERGCDAASGPGC